jgi:Ca2+-transporting ATPase
VELKAQPPSLSVTKEAWHNLSQENVLAKLNSSRNGLSLEEVGQRLLQYGPNELTARKRTNPVLAFLRQFMSPLIYILLIAAVISLVVGHFMDAAVVFGVLLLNAIVGFLQEARAEKAMEALSQMAAPKCRVKRDGNISVIPAREIVPGDILLLETGDKVSCDARLLEAVNLKVNESALTGESVPVEKTTHSIHGKDSPMAERHNMIYMGTTIAYGRGTAVAAETGMSTEIGAIATAIQDVKPEPTPLQKSVNRASRFIIVFFLAICVLIVVVGLLRGLPWLDVFLLSVAAAVSAIPEGLPAVLTVVLSVGMHTMARRNAVIRRLVAVETLGAATVICSDKTGTLTLNQMTVRHFFTGGRWAEVTGEGYRPEGEFHRDGQTFKAQDDTTLLLMLRIGTLCNDARLTRDSRQNYAIFGDPTEGALVVAAAKVGLDKETLEQSYPRLAEIPFQSEKLYMATLHAADGHKVVYVKGSSEKLLAMSRAVLEDGKTVPLDETLSHRIMDANNAMAKQALRVLATAYLEMPAETESIKEADLKGNLVFVGLAGMADPPREEAKEAIRLAHQAGIRVIMITGDNRITAEAIASALGLPKGKALTSAELAKMSDEELAREIDHVYVFARIEPLHKLRIVNALKKKGHVVAMTGDGVNDAPALKSADIGIAMGITGTDVAKESANMILADDNFASIVAAVDEGRAIFNRLRNVIYMLFSTNLGQLLALIFGLIFIGEAPLLAVQILWINMVSDTSTAIPVGLEPKAGDELKQAPRDPRVGIIYPGMIFRILFQAIPMALGIYFIFRWSFDQFGLAEAQTIAFCTMAVFAWAKALNARSDEITVFKLGFFKNRWLVISITCVILLQGLVVYLPFLQGVFRTAPLDLFQWGLIFAAGFVLFGIEELRKLFFPRLFSLGKLKPLEGKGILRFIR